MYIYIYINTYCTTPIYIHLWQSWGYFTLQPTMQWKIPLKPPFMIHFTRKNSYMLWKNGSFIDNFPLNTVIYERVIRPIKNLHPHGKKASNRLAMTNIAIEKSPCIAG